MSAGWIPEEEDASAKPRKKRKTPKPITPRRLRNIATYYLDQGRFIADDVTEDMLFSAAERIVAGIRRMIELELDPSEPRIATSAACRWCRVLKACEPGQISLREFDDPLEDLD